MFLPKDDADHVAARLHGRRSRLAEGDHLRRLCDLSTPNDLSRQIYPTETFAAVAGFEKRLVQELADETVELATAFTGAAGDFLRQFGRRFQIENLKVLLRGRASGADFPTLERHLIALPRQWGLPGEALLGARDAAAVLRLLPGDSLRAALRPWLKLEAGEATPFLIEGLLDRDVHLGCLKHLARLAAEEHDAISPIIRHEADFFNLMVTLRGRFHHGLPSEQLTPLHVPGAGISRARFHAMLVSPQPAETIQLARESVFGSAPPPDDTAQCELESRRRLLKLANRAFRRSHLGLGAIAGYLAIRRVTVANLILVAQGLRLRVDAENLRARVITLDRKEAARV